MNNRKIDLLEMSDVIRSISQYYEMVNYFPSIDSKQDETVKPFVTKNGLYENDVYRGEIMKNWGKIDVHIIDQMWGSTSCGWGGMGGAAMSNKFNVVIENKRNNAFFVYWDGRFAYAAEINDNINYSNLPSIDNCNESLNIIYNGKGKK